jgi:hypothetical protein
MKRAWARGLFFSLLVAPAGTTRAQTSSAQTAAPEPPAALLATASHPAGASTTAALGTAAPSAAAASATTAPQLTSPGGGTCVEHLPEGKARPVVKDTFPSQGISGHRVILRVEIEHGLGERVLPSALQIQTGSDAAKALQGFGFSFPDSKGPAQPHIRRNETQHGATTVVQLPLVALAQKPGPSVLTLPPLPIAVARAGGEVITLCTQTHSLALQDPTANEPNAAPKANPKPGRQKEFWGTLRNAVYGAALGLLVAVLAYAGVRAWRRRPRTAAPPAPPRPPWEVALETLLHIAQAQLLEQGRLDEHFDRVSSTLRKYLGDRFGFDGLESTSQEILEHLQAAPEAYPILLEVQQFLQESDLVKFANLAPTEAQCHGMLQRTEGFVRRTVPSPATSAAQVSSLQTGDAL